MDGWILACDFIYLYVYVCVCFHKSRLHKYFHIVISSKSINPIFPQSFSQLSHLFTHTPLTHSLSHSQTYKSTFGILQHIKSHSFPFSLALSLSVEYKQISSIIIG